MFCIKYDLYLITFNMSKYYITHECLHWSFPHCIGSFNIWSIYNSG